MPIPQSTYRVQLTPEFGFHKLTEILDYLANLGISAIYASPILRAKSGSTHGYDVTDPTVINPQLGSKQDWEELLQQIDVHHLGWIQDIVPNHMAYTWENVVLQDIFEHGEKSKYFEYLDMDWDHPYQSLQGKLLAPFLGKMYAECLENGEIQLKYDQNGLSACYYDVRFPLKIQSYFRVFSKEIPKLEEDLGANHPEVIHLLGILHLFQSIANIHDHQPAYQAVQLSKQMLWEAYSQHPLLHDYMDYTLQTWNGKPGLAESFQPLDSLLSEQFFRLSFWKVASEEINYRRFFSINDLISLRITDAKVFHYTHHRILELLQEHRISGLRIDHIDGLNDPTGYLKKLRSEVPEAYIVVEKILDLQEHLPRNWPIHGTTGYDFLNQINSLFCQSQNEAAFNHLYRQFTQADDQLDTMIKTRKRLILENHITGDIDNLAYLMKKVFSRHRYGRDIALYGLRRALVEIMILFPVYRTYIDKETLRSQDEQYIRTTVARAKEINPALTYSLDLVEKFLLLQFDSNLSEEEKVIWLQFVMRFQQFTGPLVAKAVEDTLFYVYNRLLALNEVGSEIHHFGITLEEFHANQKLRCQIMPHSMTTTSTHDTKRSEDVRARLLVLSEIPQQWQSQLECWSHLNQSKRQVVKGKPAPDRNDEYFLYQTLLGVWPTSALPCANFQERICNYVIKAIREAKVHTGWLKPEIEYENAYLTFVHRILDENEGSDFLKEFLPFQSWISWYGFWNSLAMMVLKVAAPGVPDFYQGTEIWDLSLVDPDNRHPVDFARCKQYLQEMQHLDEHEILPHLQNWLQNPDDGRIKFWITHRCLQARRKVPQIFLQGEYIALDNQGPASQHLVSLARRKENQWVVAVVPRFLTSLVIPSQLPIGKLWHDTQVILPSGNTYPNLWYNAITGQSYQLNGASTWNAAQILEHCPVAFLVSES